MVGADSGIEVRAPVDGRSAEVLTPDALSFVASLQREFGAPSHRAARREAGAPGAHRGRRAPRLPDRDCSHSRGRLAGGRGAARAPRPALRDHRPRRAQDDDQRTQLRRQGLHGRLRGRELADLPELRGRPGELLRRRAPHDLARHAREELPAERGDGGPARAPARLAPAREARPPRRRARLRRPLRLRPLPPCERARAPRARPRALLLPAQAGEPPRGAPLERRLLLRAGRARAPARLDPRHRPHRDDPGGVRDGRDPLRAPRAFRRAQRGPLGLHLLRHQEVPRPARVRPA